MAELIKVGAMQLRFLRTKYDTSGALDMFEVVIPPNSRMPVPHHHRDWEETIYGLEGVITWTVAGKRIEIQPRRRSLHSARCCARVRQRDAGDCENALRSHARHS